MLKLLLDELISPDVAEGLRRRQKSIQVQGLAEWENGQFLGATDDWLLRAALAQKRTLVTYDRKTIAPLLKTWAEAEFNHGGVIFVNDKTIRPSDFGGLIRALHELFIASAKWDWTNRVCYLRR